MIVTAQYTLPEKHADDMRQAINDGDHSWVLETLSFARLERAVEDGQIVGTGAIAPRPRPPQ